MRGRRLLVVDDDRSNSMVVERILTPLGYSVDVAQRGSEALELVERLTFDLAILDYQMPETDGVQLFRQIREVQPELPGVLLTAYPTIDKIFPAMNSGIFRVLSKPVNAKELVTLVETLVG